MAKVDDYRHKLRMLATRDAYLLQESGLPGPRGNIELARAVADEGDRALFERYLAYDPAAAPTHSPYEFLAFCGVLGQGKLLVEGDRNALQTLRICASDPRWRIREAVAMALQRYGSMDMASLIQEMAGWCEGNLLEKRAAAAAICEPSLLRQSDQAEQVLYILDRITASMLPETDRRCDDFQALRKGLGYCWSVAAAACPDPGRALMEAWFRSDDRDILWLMKQNLRKKRLQRMDLEWVSVWQAELGM
jgi:hypothetical protein